MGFNNQCERVLAFMKEHGSITSFDAERYISVRRLASRISDMRKSGLAIGFKWQKGVNQYGEPYRVKVYFLEGGNDEVLQK